MKPFNDICKLPTVSRRYFNVHGPRQDPSFEYAAVIPKLIRRVLNDKPSVICGDGEQIRDFTFMKHIMRVNILAAESDKTGVFNMEGGRRVTMNKLARMIANILEKDNLERVHDKPTERDVKQPLTDISLAQDRLGYEPE